MTAGIMPGAEGDLPVVTGLDQVKWGNLSCARDSIAPGESEGY